MRSVFDCSLYELNKSHDPEGNLTFIYENVHVPFPINRVFYSYDIPGGEDRGRGAGGRRDYRTSGLLFQPLFRALHRRAGHGGHRYREAHRRRILWHPDGEKI